MAEPVSIASGILALTVFAFESSVSVYQIGENFQGNEMIARDLQKELEALDGVLQSLQETAAHDVAGFLGLNVLLFSSDKACKEFIALIIKCTSHSGGERTSVQD